MKTLKQQLQEQIEEAKDAEDLMDFEANIDRIIDAVREWLEQKRPDVLTDDKESFPDDTDITIFNKGALKTLNELLEELK